MKFHKNVTMFDFAGIPIVANYDNGIIIGLTAAGAEICRKLLVEDLDRSEISLVDQSLFDQLSNSCFLRVHGIHPHCKRCIFMSRALRFNMSGMLFVQGGEKFLRRPLPGMHQESVG